MLPTQVSVPPPRRELVRHDLSAKKRKDDGEVESEVVYCDAQANTQLTWLEIEDMKKELGATKKELEECKAECNVIKQKTTP